MYQYTSEDTDLALERVAQFKEQTQRYMAGALSEDEFRPLRLMNGLYIQTHAPMLRIAIPYGMLSSAQLRALADISDRYDRGYGHFTTRQNIQLNWVRLEQVPDLLEDLAQAGMHAIQTSGNCIRNVTTDHLAGAAADEIADPRPWCELLRQWSTFHPEFSFLPRKFKIAVCGTKRDRAATLVHDIGIFLRAHPEQPQSIVADVYAGGGLGRTPHIGSLIGDGIEQEHLLRFLEATMRIYNLYGRRDNKFKARIKILVQALGVEEFTRQVLEEYQQICQSTPPLEAEYFAQIARDFELELPEAEAAHELDTQIKQFASFDHWYQQNTQSHRSELHRCVYLSLKPLGGAPGDMDSKQMRAVAELADQYSAGEIRVSHTQNLILAHVPKNNLYALYQQLDQLNLARSNIDSVSDIICCPGLDYCGLANTNTIGVVQQIDQHLVQAELHDRVGDVKIKISGCMNACGHHHVGHIGILGVEKKGEEWYQIQLGGSAERDANLGKVLGPAVPKADLPVAIEKLLRCYLHQRQENETFLGTFNRLGNGPFKAALYGN
ncbi:MAG: nitrite/sulfite reductase [Gammaproteobacteria bacterium]